MTKPQKIATCLVLLSLSLGASRLSAQESLPTLAEIQKAYDALKFDEVEELGQAALQHTENYSPSDLVQLHLLLGYAGFVNNRTEQARQHFESALSLRPHLTLDSLLVSPKIVRFFEQVKNEYRVGLASRNPAVKYVVLEDRRLAALRRSLLLPGWGQRHLQRPKRGLIFTLSFLAAVGGGAAFHILQQQAHDRYLAATTPDRIERQYEIYNHRYQLRNALFATAGGIWALNVFDVFLASPAVGSIQQSGNQATSVGVRLSFPLSRK